MPFTAAIAGGRTVHTLFSGPAAGAQASAYLAREAASSGLVTLDMGGTSADIAFIEGGVPLEVTEGVIARRQVDVPALDMTTISAGGGSIAWIDGGGFLNVGPQSAGADPGPACYGRGGTRPTVTDADLVCGYLNPDYFLGGAQRLDVAAARAALAGAHRRATEDGRARRRRRHPAHRRHAHGRRGAGVRGQARRRSHGVHACCRSAAPAPCMPPRWPRSSACDAFSCRRGRARSRRSACSAPTWCTTISARSCARSPRSRPSMPRTSSGSWRRRRAHELAAEGMSPADARFARELDLRYTGQGYELRTPLDGLFAERLTAESLAAARERFDERHAQIHGHAAKERPVEVVSYRLRVRVAVPKYEPRAEAAPATPRAAAEAVKGRRTVYFDWHDTIDRSDRLRARPARHRHHHRGPCHRRAIRRHHRDPARLERAGRRLPQSDPAKRRDHGRHHHPDPAQQDREPGRRDALPFLSLGLFDHHPRVARLQLRDPRPRRAA